MTCHNLLFTVNIHLKHKLGACIRVCFIDTPICPRNYLKLLQPALSLRSRAHPHITCDASRSILLTDPHHCKKALLSVVTAQALVFTYNVVVVGWQNPLKTKQTTISKPVLQIPGIHSYRVLYKLVSLNISSYPTLHNLNW